MDTIRLEAISRNIRCTRSTWTLRKTSGEYQSDRGVDGEPWRGTMARLGSRRGSRMMIDEPDAIPVGILFFSSLDGIGRFNRPFRRQRRQFRTDCNPLLMLQQQKETSISGNVRFCNLYWATCSRWSRQYLFLARWQRLFISGAIGIQVIVGALTTGVAAAGSAHVWSFSQSFPP